MSRRRFLRTVRAALAAGAVPGLPGLRVGYVRSEFEEIPDNLDAQKRREREKRRGHPRAARENAIDA
jgi:hypothetical protein